MNVDRREPNGAVNNEAPNGQSVYITTAGSKTCFMYSKLVELVVNSILRPNEFYVFGMDYRVPVRYGLITQAKIDDQRLSSTYSSEAFARESMSIWTGNAQDAWFEADMLLRRRTLLKTERKWYPPKDGGFYIISADVGRLNCVTAISVIKVMPRSDHFHANLVYLEVIQGQNFITQQAPRLKKLIQIYQPREIVIDTNGPGIGLMDAMVLESFDQTTGERFPAYYGFNVESHLPPQKKTPVDEPMPAYNAIVYEMKADSVGNKNSDMWANLYSRLCSNQVSLLASEQIVKNKLLATKKGQKMTLYDRRVFLMPYEMTSRLVDELNNLRLKPTGLTNEIKVEQISRSTPKDRVSSLQYGLWRVKYYEDKAMRKHRRKGSGGGNKYAFFSPKGGRRK